MLYVNVNKPKIKKGVGSIFAIKSKYTRKNVTGFGITDQVVTILYCEKYCFETLK